MFTMTMRNPDGTVLAQGQSQSGEDWQATLLRLYQEAIGDGSRRVIDPTTPWHGEKQDGSGTVRLVREAGPVGGLGHPIEFVRIETDPPQF